MRHSVANTAAKGKGAVFAGAAPRQKLPAEIAEKSRDSPQCATGYTATCLNAGRLPAIAVAVYWPPAISLLVAIRRSPENHAISVLEAVSGFCQGLIADLNLLTVAINRGPH
jgi:hypothetical protein